MKNAASVRPGRASALLSCTSLDDIVEDPSWSVLSRFGLGVGASFPAGGESLVDHPLSGRLPRGDDGGDEYVDGPVAHGAFHGASDQGESPATSSCGLVVAAVFGLCRG